MKSIKCFEPIINRNCETIILGTIPGKISLEKNQYYGNPNNCFWDILFRLFKPKWGKFDYIDNSVNYNHKKEILLSNNIGLWDVIKTCNREGSSDKNIKNEELNDFNDFFNNYKNIKKVIFNGKGKNKMSANKLFSNSFDNLIMNKSTYCLNSTSSQNPNNPFRILGEWNEVLKKKK